MSSPFLDLIPFGFGLFQRNPLGVGHENRGGSVHPPLGFLALLVESLYFLGKNKKTFRDLGKLCSERAEMVAVIEPVKDELPGNIRPVDLEGCRSLQNIAMDFRTKSHGKRFGWNLHV
jgi:hypothetical protein